MSKPDFEMAQNAATNFLLHHDIQGLSFNYRNLDLISEGIIIDTVQNYATLTNHSVECFLGRNIDGCYVIKKDDICLILYDENSTDSEAHRTFGIVHELGHIFCGHTTDDKNEEIEANFFAAQVLMPEIVSYYILYHYEGFKIDAYDLMCIFNVSYEAASKRITTFNNRRSWSSGINDKLLLAKFKPFIKKHYANKPKKYNDKYEYLFAV